MEKKKSFNAELKKNFCIRNKMGLICQIFRNSDVSPSLIRDLPARIEECFHQIELKVSTNVQTLEPSASAFDTKRNQYTVEIR